MAGVSMARASVAMASRGPLAISPPVPTVVPTMGYVTRASAGATWATEAMTVRSGIYSMASCTRAR